MRKILKRRDGTEAATASRLRPTFAESCYAATIVVPSSQAGIPSDDIARGAVEMMQACSEESQGADRFRRDRAHIAEGNFGLGGGTQSIARQATEYWATWRGKGSKVPRAVIRAPWPPEPRTVKTVEGPSEFIGGGVCRSLIVGP